MNQRLYFVVSAAVLVEWQYLANSLRKIVCIITQLCSWIHAVQKTNVYGAMLC